MNSHKQFLAIAALLGWEPVVSDGSWLLDGEPTSGHPPDYCNDLNAMHAAVDYMNRTQPDAWNDEYFLQILCGWTRGFPHRATAAQWAEAFLRTLNKWVGEA